MGAVTATGAGIVVVDHHVIYGQGLAACLEAEPWIRSVVRCTTPAEAWAGSALRTADLVIADITGDGVEELVREIRARLLCQVVACSARCDRQLVLAAVGAGAIGVLAKDDLTPKALLAGVRAALTGTGVMPPDVLTELLSGITQLSRDVLAPRGLSLSLLTTREQQVLRLVAEGHDTREVARELAYSERTVKNVIHDVVTKLGVRSRSHAVAHAVRQGLI